MDEVLQAVKGVNWRKLGRELIGEEEEFFDDDSDYYHANPRITNLDRIDFEHETDEARLRAVVEEFLTADDYFPLWRKVIWVLYRVDEIDKAQQISSYAEPLQGMLEYERTFFFFFF